MTTLKINGIQLKNGKINLYSDCVKVSYDNCISKEQKASLADYLKKLYAVNLVFFRN